VVGRPFWHEAEWQIWSFAPCLISVFNMVRLNGKRVCLGSPGLLRCSTVSSETIWLDRTENVDVFLEMKEL